MKHMRGLTLLELMSTVTIALTLAMVGTPLMMGLNKDAAFQNFATELTGVLVAARRNAQITERAAAVDFKEREHWLYAGEIWEEHEWRPTALIPKEAGKHNIRLGLPSEPLPHPTRPGLINKALSLTNGSRLIFGPRGSGSGTVVFSDDDGRSLCVVASSRTGRFRIYLKTARLNDWRLYY